MVKPTLQIEMWAVDRLIPYARNASTHFETQVAQIAASIAEFGFVNPVLVDPKGSIIAGHGRVLAARKLRLTEVSVVVLAHLNENEKRAFILADNRIALNAGWDEDMLRLELEALSKAGSNLENIGFDEKELDDLLAKLSDQALEDPDEVPPAQPDEVTERGDLWTLGEHRLLCGDSTDRAQLDRVLGGGASDLSVTDLPYNASYQGKTSRHMTITNDNLGNQFGLFLSAACRAMLAVNSGAIYICMSSRELHNLYQAFSQAGGHWSTYVISTEAGLP
jgi:ParB-like nuclease domain